MIEETVFRKIVKDNKTVTPENFLICLVIKQTMGDRSASLKVSTSPHYIQDLS